MHKYISSIGFSKISSEAQMKELLEKLAADADSTRFVQLDRETTLCEKKTIVSEDVGMAMYGEIDDRDHFTVDYYYPYAESHVISSKEYCSVQRHAEKETYAGMIDEYRVGISLIFYLLNPLEYRALYDREGNSLNITSVCLSALALEGTILLPVLKTESQKEKARVTEAERNSLLRAAQEGDEQAIESLTLDEFTMYNKVNRRVSQEDVYSIVDSTFMPSGLESDQYQMIGEIHNAKLMKNRITGEDLWDIQVICNEIPFRVVVNDADLLGEPEPGRRFKGRIWVQGITNFS